MLVNNYTFKYSTIVCCFLISYYTLAQITVFSYMYIKTKTTCIALLGKVFQAEIFIKIEIILAFLIIITSKLAWKIPMQISRLNWLTIIIPLIINCTYLILFADKLYYNTSNFNSTVSVITILIAGAVVLLGGLCNIAVAEYYLEVKEIENETKLQISEVKLKYDYYMQLSKDMDEVRKLSHDIRGHLNALEGVQDNIRKSEYIDSIMNRLDGFENHYDTGNPFIDNILYKKKKDSAENHIQFKAYVDLKEFNKIKDEDLCTVFSNAIENAMRECIERKKECPDGENIILIKAGRKRGFLFITCENSIRKKQADYVQVSLKTTKKDKKLHGYGLRNINAALQKYSGEFSIKVENDIFYLFIVIPLE
ncbi:sensor histidine kinase [Anaerocolumna xylanovorans]|nr:GHKL domain-containing protein [Anaerocolumna xylanovorans]